MTDQAGDVPLQRAGALVHVRDVLPLFGVSPAVVTEGLDIDLGSIEADTILPYPTAIRIVDRAATLTKCDHFGLLVGARFRLAEYGPLYRLMRTAPTLRQALIDMVTWQPGYSSGGAVYFHRFGEDFAFGFGAYERTSLGSRHVYQITAAVGFNFVVELTEGRVRPLEVLLCQRPPADFRVFERHFKTPVLFNQSQLCVVISRGDIDVPLSTANAREREALLATLAAKIAGMRRPMTVQVRHVLRPHVQREQLSFAATAAAVGLHPRTLRRRLADEGTTYEAVLEEVRFGMARELLDLTDMPIGEIGSALGYASHSAFVHAFRRWSGMAPTEWRRSRPPGGRKPE